MSEMDAMKCNKDGWVKKKLGEVGKVVTGSTPSTKDETNYNEAEYNFVKPSDIDNYKLSIIDTTENYISEKAYLKSRRLPAGSVLTTCIGIVGKVGICTKECTCNQQINAIIPNRDINNKFLAYSILSRKYIINALANAPVVPIINKKDFSDILIEVPLIAKQQRIVSELDCLNGIIEKQKEQLKQLDELAQSIFYDMFGDPMKNEKGWNLQKIKNLGNIITGSTPSTKDCSNYAAPDYNFVKPSDIDNDAITLIYETDQHVSQKAYMNSRKIPIRSILVTCIGIVGKVGINMKDCICNQQINVILPNKNIVGKFLAYNISLIRPIITRLANAPIVPIINKTAFSNIQVINPPLSLQQTFASKIEAIEHQKELIKKSIAETETLFNSRMDYYFG